MNAGGLQELFEPFAAVVVKRMFGGHGVYADGLCFAIKTDGEAFLKVDGETEAAFSAAGSLPFITKAKGKPMLTSFWRLPAEAYDDADTLRRFAELGLEAASAPRRPRRSLSNGMRNVAPLQRAVADRAGRSYKRLTIARAATTLGPT
ncbi:TfoX/Sxy family protein [Roseiarcus sp.]|uniref:TfoX/Sxy family protein n=1 Tax=Roseiarcus sp. TaxID=1969460 RepID=UPI003F970B2C